MKPCAEELLRSSQKISQQGLDHNLISLCSYPNQFQVDQGLKFEPQNALMVWVNMVQDSMWQNLVQANYTVRSIKLVGERHEDDEFEASLDNK